MDKANGQSNHFWDGLPPVYPPPVYPPPGYQSPLGEPSNTERLGIAQNSSSQESFSSDTSIHERTITSHFKTIARCIASALKTIANAIIAVFKYIFNKLHDFFASIFAKILPQSEEHQASSSSTLGVDYSEEVTITEASVTSHPSSEVHPEGELEGGVIWGCNDNAPVVQLGNDEEPLEQTIVAPSSSNDESGVALEININKETADKTTEAPSNNNSESQTYEEPVASSDHTESEVKSDIESKDLESTKKSEDSDTGYDEEYSPNNTQEQQHSLGNSTANSNRNLRKKLDSFFKYSENKKYNINKLLFNIKTLYSVYESCSEEEFNATFIERVICYLKSPSAKKPRSSDVISFIKSKISFLDQKIQNPNEKDRNQLLQIKKSMQQALDQYIGTQIKSIKEKRSFTSSDIKDYLPSEFIDILKQPVDEKTANKEFLIDITRGMGKTSFFLDQQEFWTSLNPESNSIQNRRSALENFIRTNSTVTEDNVNFLLREQAQAGYAIPSGLAMFFIREMLTDTMGISGYISTMNRVDRNQQIKYYINTDNRDTLTISSHFSDHIRFVRNDGLSYEDILACESMVEIEYDLQNHDNIRIVKGTVAVKAPEISQEV